jgi:hypothetical protein
MSPLPGLSMRGALALPGFVSVLPDKLFEERGVVEALMIRRVSYFAESPVDGAQEHSLAAQEAAVSQNTGPIAPHVIANQLEFL